MTKKSGSDRPLSREEFEKAILAMCPSAKIVERNGEKHFVFPPLAQARKEFEAYCGHPIEWPK